MSSSASVVHSDVNAPTKPPPIAATAMRKAMCFSTGSMNESDDCEPYLVERKTNETRIGREMKMIRCAE